VPGQRSGDDSISLRGFGAMAGIVARLARRQLRDSAASRSGALISASAQPLKAFLSLLDLPNR
jgi:hypothetical protein